MKIFKRNLYQQFFFIAIIAFLTFSCAKKENNCVSKLILIVLNNSDKIQIAGNYHMFIASYIEYKPDSLVKIAKGNLLYNNTDSTRCNYQYFTYTPKLKLKGFIDSLLCDQNFDSSYVYSESPVTIANSQNDGAKCILIYTLPEGEKTVFARINLLPKNLKLVTKRLYKIYSSNMLVQTKTFKIDTLGKKLEQRFYKILPPETLPSSKILK